MGENISTRVAYGKALAEFGTDEKLFVFDADLKKCTMTLYFAEKYPERFFNIGIAEANMVDIAAGFATCGATALVHTFAIFATGRTYDQIRNSVCYPGLNVKIVGSHGGLTVGEDGAKGIVSNVWDFDDIENAMIQSVKDKANIVKSVIKIG